MPVENNIQDTSDQISLQRLILFLDSLAFKGITYWMT